MARWRMWVVCKDEKLCRKLLRKMGNCAHVAFATRSHKRKKKSAKKLTPISRFVPILLAPQTRNVIVRVAICM